MMVHTTSAQVRLAKIDRQIAELHAERAKIVGMAEVVSVVELNEKVTSDPINRVVLSLQMAQGPMTSEQLQKDTDLGKPTLTRALKSLLDTGTIVKKGNARATRYSLAGLSEHIAKMSPEEDAFCEKLLAIDKANPVVAEPERPKQKRVRMAGIEETILDKLDHVGRDSEWLQQETGLDQQRLWRGLRKLVGQGRVQKIGNTRAARYSLRMS